ncbi:MAG: ABC transporter ATP-binding protein [Stellaceae bacterium]
MSVATAEAPKGAAGGGGVLLDVRDLDLWFRDEGGWLQVLNKVGFDVRPGEVVGIVGESGCGKSVTALSILGLLPRQGVKRSGNILFEGHDLATLSERQMRAVRGRRIGMVFQEPMSALDPVFTVGAQIAETVRTHFGGSHRAAKARTVAALDAVGIPSPAQCAEMYPMSLSGGMRQRVMIAMALVCEPRLLIADEPTTALDVTIQAQIVALMLELGSRTGTAILFITHNLGLVAESCTRMVTMYAGEVVEEGAVEAILERPYHPYTAGLLASLPHGRERKSRLTSIPGRVPSAREMPQGCRFSPRCTHVAAVCAAPQRLEDAGGRQVRCARYRSLTLGGATA